MVPCSSWLRDNIIPRKARTGGKIVNQDSFKNRLASIAPKKAIVTFLRPYSDPRRQIGQSRANDRVHAANPRKRFESECQKTKKTDWHQPFLRPARISTGQAMNEALRNKTKTFLKLPSREQPRKRPPWHAGLFARQRKAQWVYNEHPPPPPRRPGGLCVRVSVCAHVVVRAAAAA